MPFEDYIKVIPYIFPLFVPGFVFIKTFCFFRKSKSNPFEGTAVASVAISYVLNLAVGLLAKVIKVPEATLEFISVFLAFVTALVLVKFKTSGFLKGILKWIGKVSDGEDIWEDIFDSNKGSRIRCYSKFNNKDVMIRGDVKYFESCEDGECNIALINYVIKYHSGNVYKLGNRSDEPILYLNTRNIHGLEVTYGQ